MQSEEISIIKVERLFKKYGDFNAVNGIDFQVKKGEVFGLLGPNGAGKTTTLEIIETLLKKTSGKVFVDGIDLDKHPKDIRKVIGVQLQHSGFATALRLGELIELFAALYNVRVNIAEVLKSVDLLEKRKAYFAKLSGGQKQRFSIAVSLLNKPKVIFLDEPTTGLDPVARRNLWDMIKNVNEQGTSVILTTHYLEEAEQLCDRVAFIDRGNIIDIDSPESFINKLLDSGFTPQKEHVQKASLEDVYISLTGKEWRE